MTPENFVYWLQGYLELNDAINKGVCPTDVPTRSTAMGALEYMTPSQIQVIKDHLRLVLEKKTPNRPFSFSHMDCAPVIPSGITADPVYYQYNGPVPPATC